MLFNSAITLLNTINQKNHRLQYINVCSTFKFAEIHICFINENNLTAKIYVKDVPLSC